MSSDNGGTGLDVDDDDDMRNDVFKTTMTAMIAKKNGQPVPSHDMRT